MTLPAATIDTLAYGGNGVCRIDGKVCFVPFSCPGDEVSLRITTQKKSYSTAAIDTLITPAASRTSPECSVFGSCGGCNWQHISYAAQLRHKRDLLAEALWRGARVPAELVGDIVPAVHQYGYRSRIQFKVSGADAALQIGFYRQGTHQVVDAVNGCPIAAPAINQVLTCCREILRSYPDAGRITGISIDAGDSGVVVIIQQSGRGTSGGRKYLAARGADFGPCTGLFLSTEQRTTAEHVWGSSEIMYRMKRKDGLDDIQLTYPPGGFAQVHLQQNSALLTVIRKLGQFSPETRLLDLYCGNGNFSLPLAGEVAAVTGIEGNPDSIRAAEHNRALNRVANARFFCDDVTAGIRRLADDGHCFDIVLLDPPRAGAADAVAGLERIRPDRMIYVSCDPVTLARDCALLAGCGYEVAASVPVDMFPQTYHIESVTLLINVSKKEHF